LRQKPTSRQTSVELERLDEGFDHFGFQEVAVELGELIQPEVITGEVIVRRVIGVASQIAEVFNRDR
jgi:hypothetical protein